MIGTAETLPFDENAFDAAMAMLTVHHWPDRVLGLREMRRVACGPVLVFTCDPDANTEFWIYDYGPEFAEIEQRRYGNIDVITGALGGHCEIQPIPVTRDCTDGFQVAFYGRPEAFLDARVRGSQSAWKFLPPGAEERIVQSFAPRSQVGRMGPALWAPQNAALHRLPITPRHRAPLTSQKRGHSTFLAS